MRLVDQDHRITSQELLHRWSSLSRIEQMAHIGDRVRQATAAKRRGDRRALRTAYRTVIERFILTFTDPKWNDRLISPGGLKEPAIAFAVCCDAIVGGNTYGTDLDALDRYFTQFALAARRGR